MNSTEIKNEIITSIATLSAAIAKVEGNEIQKKEALGAIGLVANYNLARVCTALNNQIFPEGEDNYIPVDENGLPLSAKQDDVTEDSGADDDTDIADEEDEEENSTESTTTAPIDRVFASIKSYFPTFDKDILIQRFANGGVKASLAYLFEVTGTTQLGELDRKVDGENIVFTFKVANGTLTANYTTAENYLGELVKYSGGDLVSVTSNEIDGGREFKIVVKGIPASFHELHLSPFGKLLLSLILSK